MTIPTIGKPWPEQGGIYAGQRLIDGKAHHIIVSPGVEHDIEGVEFRDVEKVVAEVDEINGFSDWRAPDHEDLMLAYVNVPDQFSRTGGLNSVYWSRSEHHGWTWAVDFEYGYVLSYDRRDYEFQVRPVRSFVFEQT